MHFFPEWSCEELPKVLSYVILRKLKWHFASIRMLFRVALTLYRFFERDWKNLVLRVLMSKCILDTLKRETVFFLKDLCMSTMKNYGNNSIKGRNAYWNYTAAYSDYPPSNLPRFTFVHDYMLHAEQLKWWIGISECILVHQSNIVEKSETF